MWTIGWNFVWYTVPYADWNLIWKHKNYINFCNYAVRKNRAYCIFSNVAKLVLCELLLTFWSNLVGSCSPWRSWSRSAAFQFSTALHEPLHFTQDHFDKYCPEIMKSCLFVWSGIWALWPTWKFMILISSFSVFNGTAWAPALYASQFWQILSRNYEKLFVCLIWGLCSLAKSHRSAVFQFLTALHEPLHSIL